MEEKQKTILTAPAVIQTIKTLVDRTISLRIDLSRELPSEEITNLMSLRQKEGWFLFSENKVDECAIPDVKADTPSVKTPSYRLRGVLYRIWEAGERTNTFEEFYLNYMEKLIEKLKEKLG